VKQTSDLRPIGTSTSSPKILELKPMNGWAISLRLKSISGECAGSGGIPLPGIAQLEKEGWIHRRVEQTENNRRKIVFTHPPGKETARIEAANWAAALVRHFHIVRSRRPSARAPRRFSATTTLAVHNPVAWLPLSRRRGVLSSMRNCSSTSSDRLRKASQGPFPQKRRGTPRCARWTDWNAKKRRCETSAHYIG